MTRETQPFQQVARRLARFISKRPDLITIKSFSF